MPERERLLERKARGITARSGSLTQRTGDPRLPEFTVEREEVAMKVARNTILQLAAALS